METATGYKTTVSYLDTVVDALAYNLESRMTPVFHHRVASF